MAHNKWEENSAIKNFREYLRIPSVHPDIDYEPCVNFIKKMAKEMDLPVKVFIPVPKNPIVIITWEGTDTSLPAVLLNSHMDVVPVFEESWTYPPFSAHLTPDGKIYARGSQDMKCVGMQYIEAVRRLKSNGVRLRRTIHICFVPDEERGGHKGMAEFVKKDDFTKLNIGLSLDEGVANPTDNYYFFNGERSIWQIVIKCPGKPGHGSLLSSNTAGEKMRVIIDRFMDYRQQEKEKLEGNKNLFLGDVTTINLTMLSGGVQTNVLPESLTAVFDMRLAPDVDHDKFETMIRCWCEEAGEGITIEFEQKEPDVEITRLDDSNPFWIAFKRAADELNLKLDIQILPGGTDSRYVRELGIPALGFSPISNTEILLHDNDEYLHADTFLKGIDIYEKLIPAVANV